MAADGHAVLQRQIERLHTLPDRLVSQAAPKIARAVEREIRAQIAAGRAPDGTPWTPRKEDGGKPLQNAAESVTVRAIGATIIVRIDGVEALHHLGRARGGVKREIIPTGEIPDPVARAIKLVLERDFRSLMGVA